MSYFDTSKNEVAK